MVEGLETDSYSPFVDRNHEVVNVEAGRVLVCGTTGNDNVVVNRDSSNATTMWVKVNGQKYSNIPPQSLYIETGDGDDVVNVKIPVGAEIDGGAGTTDCSEVVRWMCYTAAQVMTN